MTASFALNALTMSSNPNSYHGFYLKFEKTLMTQQGKMRRQKGSFSGLLLEKNLGRETELRAPADIENEGTDLRRSGYRLERLSAVVKRKCNRQPVTPPLKR
jgi:hypothetical protein